MLTYIEAIRQQEQECEAETAKLRVQSKRATFCLIRVLLPGRVSFLEQASRLVAFDAMLPLLDGVL